MLIAFFAHDKPGALPIRQANRAAHVEYLKASDAVVQAGPLLNAEGEMAGSLVILDVQDMAAAESWAKEDPYAKADLFADTELVIWNRVIG